MSRVRRRLVPVALLAFLVLGTAAGAGLAIASRNGSPAPSFGHTESTATQADRTTTTTTIDPCGGVGPEPHSVDSVDSLEPLLLVAADLTQGFKSSGPGTTSMPEFLAALPASVPEVVVNFNTALGSQTPGGVPSEGISEALALAPSSTQAVDLLNQVLAVGRQCDDFGPPIDLPGPIVGLVVYNDSGGGNREEYINFAQLYAQKGPYVVSVDWFNSAPTGVGPDAPTSAPPLPSPAAMAAVVDAALNRLP